MMTAPTIRVVLIHGLFGFDRCLGWEYFYQARTLLEAQGVEVHVPVLPWSGRIVARAEVLAEQLSTLAGPLHLIAHSMGGLDARYWISRLGGADKVASLTTLATPHHGTSLADYLTSRLSPFRLFAGVHDLTRRHMQGFNEAVPDDPRVVYRSYAAARPEDELPWPLIRRYGRVIRRNEGDNDGLVPVVSARWGEYQGCLPCDHFELIDRDYCVWPFCRRRPYDMTVVYGQVHDRLRMHGR